ncbi:MAG: hypothetical protein ACK46Y_07395 [Fluviicola sp.]
MKVTLSFSLLLLFLQSCKDKNNVDNSINCSTNPSECQYVKEAKDFFYFKVGSWWVYEEEISLVKDSVFVTSSYNYSNYQFDTYLYSSLTGITLHYFPEQMYEVNGCSSTEPVSKQCLRIKWSESKPGEFLWDGKILGIKYNLNSYVGSHNIYYPNNFVTVKSIYTTYTDVFSFNKTLKLSENASRRDNNQPVNYYLSSGVGIVRKELLDSNKVWRLISYHIEP